MSYTSGTTVANYLGRALSAGESALMTSWIAAVKRFIENYTHCVFEQEAAATRYFDGNGQNELNVDEFLSISALVILETDGTELQTLTEGASSDFITYPYNVSPKFKIILQPSSSIQSFPNRRRSVKITGTWNNSSTVPDDIALAATMLVAGIIADSKSNGKEVSSESLGGYSISYDQNSNLNELAGRIGVKQILDQYIIYEL
jgi:hypothetical protein